MRLSKKIAIAAATVITAAPGTLVAAEPATAAPEPLISTAPGSQAPPAVLTGPNGEQPTQWGVAVVPVASSRGAMTPLATKKVGGGTWNYGTRAAGLDGSTCYSNYIHPSKKHTATVIKAGYTYKDYANPDVWAKAKITAGAAYTCYTYWGVY